jgi:DNA-binding transcriptional regulator YdaS (Cro superfamily)
MDKTFTPEQRRRFAAAVGKNEQYIYQCLTGLRNMSPSLARQIEDKFPGEVSRKDLCQDTWRSIWPELAEWDGSERRANPPCSGKKAK